MEVTLKRLTKNGAFDNEVIFLTQQKAYSFGRRSQNDIVLFAPTVSKHHCIFHRNSEGLFVEVLKSLSGVVVNGKKYSTGSMVCLHNKDLVGIGFFKYKVEMKPIVQDFDPKTNFTSDLETDYERIKEEDLSDMNIKSQSESEIATIDEDTHEENCGSIQTDESYNSEVSREIKEELSLEEETQEISLDEIDSSMQITIDEEDLKPLLSLNSTGEELTDPKTIIEISRNPETLKLSGFSSFVREKTHLRRSRRINNEILQKSSEVSFENGVSDKPKQNKISLKENAISKNQVSINPNEIEEQWPQEKNSVSNNQDRISPDRIFDGISRNQNLIVQERLSIGNSENAVRTFEAHSVKNLPTESSSSNTKLEIRSSSHETELLLTGKKLEPSRQKIQAEVTKCSPSTRRMKSCQVEDKRLPEKRLFVTLIDILKNPISDFPSINVSFSISSKSDNSNKQTRKGKMSHEKKVFSCTLCHKKLTSKQSLGIHENMHSRGKPYNCEKCGKNFINNWQLQNHLVSHTKERLFTCAICEKSFKLKAVLTDHLKIHSGVSRQTCGICKKILANKSSLEYHMKTHTVEGKFKCNECLKLFIRENDLQKHMKSHANQKPHKCPHCDKCYNFKSVLTRHVRRNHTLKGRHKCNECGKVLRCKSEYEEHQRIHTGERPVICQICTMAFPGKKTLWNHMKYFHVAKFTCSECEETFHNKSKLRRHLKIHFPEDGKICPDCGYVANYQAQLMDHRRVHSGERPFKCFECDKAFSAKSNLRIHMVKHTGNYPYRCKKCGAGFANLCRLKSHYASHAESKPFVCTICCFSFRLKATCKKHYVTHKSSVMKCEICELAFRTKATFQEHYSKHLKIQGEYNCTICKTEFKSQKNLIAHCQKTLDLWGKCSSDLQE